MADSLDDFGNRGQDMGSKTSELDRGKVVSININSNVPSPYQFTMKQMK